jgi:hypothetical protein
MDMKALLLKLNQIAENTDAPDDQEQDAVRAGDFARELIDHIAELHQSGEIDIEAPDAAEQIDAMLFWDSQDEDQEPPSIPEIEAAIKQVLRGNIQPGDIPKSESADITENTMTPQHKELAKKVHKALLSDEPAGAGFGAKLKAAHAMLRQQYGSDWRKKAGVVGGSSIDEGDDWSWQPDKGQSVKKRFTVTLEPDEIEILKDMKAREKFNHYMKVEGDQVTFITDDPSQLADDLNQSIDSGETSWSDILGLELAEGRKYYGYDDAGFSLAPGHDEGEPVYNPHYDRDYYPRAANRAANSGKYKTVRSEPKGMYFYNVPAGKDQEALQAGLKQSKSGKWYGYSDNMFGKGKYWEPKQMKEAPSLAQANLKTHQVEDQWHYPNDDSMAESMAYGQSPTQSDTSVSYSETKRDGDASVTISANANSMSDLHRVLKLAGINPDIADKYTVVEPEADADQGCGCTDQPEPEVSDITATGISKQTIIDRLRDTLKAKMAL